MTSSNANGEGPVAEVPAGEASPETLRRLEAALPGRPTRPARDEGTHRALDRHAMLLLGLVAAGIMLGVVSLLALLL